MKAMFFDEIGKDGLRYIAGWNKNQSPLVKKYLAEPKISVKSNK